MAVYNINKGYDLPLEGNASKEVENTSANTIISVQPSDFPYHKYKVLVKEGDEVLAGTPVLASKQDESLVFTSTAAGKVSSIRRGERRKLLGIDIQVGGQEAIDYGAWDLAKITKSSVDDLEAHLKQAGVWPLIRQRPFSKIADVKKLPKAIYINAMASAPLAPAQEFLCKGRNKELEVGIAALKVFQSEINFISSVENASDFSSLKNVKHSQFSGPHPAGLVSTHIAEIDPINKGDIVWYLTAEQVTLIGEYLLTGKVPTKTIVALTGADAPNKKYYKIFRGSRLNVLVNKDDGLRVISGNVLAGVNAGKDGYLGFYDNQVTVVPEGGVRYYLLSDKHWTGPGFTNFSLHNLFASKIFGRNKKWNLNTNIRGGERAIIQNNIYDEYTPLDIYTSYLIKACLAKDIDRMEELGIYEVDSEDFALATFACPSKVDVSEIIRQGLSLIEKEG